MADPIFKSYLNFTALHDAFVKRNKALGDLASVIFYNAHQSYMRNLSKANLLRMPFYVFSKDQAAILNKIAEDKKGLAIDDSIEEEVQSACLSENPPRYLSNHAHTQRASTFGKIRPTEL